MHRRTYGEICSFRTSRNVHVVSRARESQHCPPPSVLCFLQDCIQNKFEPGKIFGGDTLFSHCVFFTGIAPTDPGHYTWDQGFNGFDPGGQLVRNPHSVLFLCSAPVCVVGGGGEPDVVDDESSMCASV